MAEDGEVLDGKFCPDTALVFSKSDVQAPVERVLDGPVAAHRTRKFPGVGFDAAEEESPFGRHGPLDFTHRFDHPDGG